MSCVEIRVLQDEDLEPTYSLWKEGFSTEDLPSFEVLKNRRRQAPELLVGYFEAEELIGAISGFRFKGSCITLAKLLTHDPEGEGVCIHTMNVKEGKRRQGIGTQMLKWYASYIQKLYPDVQRVFLYAYKEKIPFYTKAGFSLKGQSPPTLQTGDAPNFELEWQLSNS